MTDSSSIDLEDNAEKRVDIALNFLRSSQLTKHSNQRVPNGKQDILASLRKGVEQLKREEKSSGIMDSLLSKS